MLKAGEDEIETVPMEATMKTTTTPMEPTSPAVDEQPIAQQPTARTNAAAASPIAQTQIRTFSPSSPPPPPPMAQPKTFGRMQQVKVKMIPDGRREQLNTRYLATLPGVLKVAEVMIGFVAFILAICADRRSTSSAWTEHITFETTLVVSVLIILYVVFPHLSLSDERTREGLVVVELVFYGLNTVFFFIAIWLMVHLAASWTAEGRGAAIMDAILCAGLCVLYGIETFIKFKAWNGQDVVSRTQSPYMHRVPPAPTHQQGAEEMKRFELGAGAAKENGDHDHQVVV